MTAKLINEALEKGLQNEGNYAALVHSLIELECSDALIKAIIVGGMGVHLKDRVAPLITVIRAYENLSAAEQMDVLYSIVDKQETRAEVNREDTKIAG